MTWIVRNIHRLMIVSGALTMTMVYAAIAPDAALESTFGTRFFGYRAGIAVLLDAMWVVVFAPYVLSTRHRSPAVTTGAPLGTA